jgi:probable phosphoglycerate mutase
MQVYFIRHGQTNYNLLGLCNDDPRKDVHLTELGLEQAQQLAEQLRDIPLQRILVSELPRTRQTAEIINRHHGLNIETQLQINDIRSGFDSRPVSEYQRAISADPLHIRCNDGESLLDHKQRIIRFIGWLAQQPQQNLLVVAHEETLRVFKGYFEKLDDETMIGLRFDNCACLSYSL